MIFALILRGVTLPGVTWKGIVYYIGSLDLTKLFTLKTWIDAASQGNQKIFLKRRNNKTKKVNFTF
jgi:hypothetical protein